MNNESLAKLIAKDIQAVKKICRDGFVVKYVYDREAVLHNFYIKRTNRESIQLHLTTLIASRCL